jgi:cytidine deaminase
MNKNLSEQEKQNLLEVAEKIMPNAYSPYSNIKIGAALLTVDGEVITGVNIENSSFGLTVCAERNAIFNAVSQGKKDFIALAIVANNEIVGSPCGACRQVIAEFAPDLPIIFKNPKEIKETTLQKLLPDTFTLVK